MRIMEVNVFSHFFKVSKGFTLQLVHSITMVEVPVQLLV